jgi:hypothetical protein
MNMTCKVNMFCLLPLYQPRKVRHCAGRCCPLTSHTWLAKRVQRTDARLGSSRLHTAHKRSLLCWYLCTQVMGGTRDAVSTCVNYTASHHITCC